MTSFKRPKTTRQHKMLDLALHDKDNLPTVAYGSAGTGKTYMAIRAAVAAVESREKQQILLVRPNVSFADSLGFLPGSVAEKLAPWLVGIDRYLVEFLGKGKLESWKNSGKIKYEALEHIQGQSFDNTFLVVDEVQLTSFQQIKVLLTRVGINTKIVLCGDVAQVSPKFRQSGLAEFLQMVDYLSLDVHSVEFTSKDIMRSEMCRKMIEGFDTWETGE